jgi:hypothetical protein
MFYALLSCECIGSHFGTYVSSEHFTHHLISGMRLKAETLFNTTALQSHSWDSEMRMPTVLMPTGHGHWDSVLTVTVLSRAESPQSEDCTALPRHRCCRYRRRTGVVGHHAIPVGSTDHSRIMPVPESICSRPNGQSIEVTSGKLADGMPSPTRPAALQSRLRVAIRVTAQLSGGRASGLPSIYAVPSCQAQ